MSKKQDRPYVRKASELEQKYNFSGNFGEIKKLIATAQRAAADALSAVAGVDAKLEEISELASKLNVLEAQSTYTAMMTDTLLKGQGMKEKIASWYKESLWTAEMVDAAVTKGIITEAEATEIKGQAVT
ncbi:MAG: XkdX family protein [Clostridia bacterium]|nr:XkdX family protein [Clostridia bacterium]MBR2388199.1 XkdX family protein [Clostridia bacterium]